MILFFSNPGARDLSFDSYRYAVVFLSSICTAKYLAFVARVGKSRGLNSFGLMWCNGLLCGPILLFWTFIRGDLEMKMNFPYLFFLGFQDLFTIGIGWLLLVGCLTIWYFTLYNRNIERQVKNQSRLQNLWIEVML